MPKLLDIFSKTKTSKAQNKVEGDGDHREKNSLVISELIGLGFEVDYKQLPVADYIINKIAIERKTLSDFKSSIVNKRIMQQLLELKQYPTPLLILEGLEATDPYAGRIHENAFRGFILSVLTEYRIPIIFTLNEKDTAKYISVLAKKQKKSEQSIRASKIFLNEREQLQFILEGFPNIGPIAAKKLLSHFGTLYNLINATEEELKSIVGKKAETLHKLINQKY